MVCDKHCWCPPSGSWSLAGSTVWWCRLLKMLPAPGRQGRNRRSRRPGGGPGTPPAGPGCPPQPGTTAWRCGPGRLRPAACRWATPRHCLHPRRKVKGRSILGKHLEKTDKHNIPGHLNNIAIQLNLLKLQKYVDFGLLYLRKIANYKRYDIYTMINKRMQIIWSHYHRTTVIIIIV